MGLSTVSLLPAVDKLDDRPNNWVKCTYSSRRKSRGMKRAACVTILFTSKYWLMCVTILLTSKYWLICVTILLTERMLLPSFLPTPAWIVGSTQRPARDFILAGANSFKELNNQHKYGLSTTTKCLSTLFRYPQPRQCG